MASTAPRADLVFTVDLDWAPDPLVADTLALFDARGVRVTVFASHATSYDFGDHEVALHPIIDGPADVAERVGQLRATYPRAEGVRCHRLVTSSPIQLALAQVGVRYTSNFMLDRCPHLRPTEYVGLPELPVYYMDNLNVRRFAGAPSSFQVESLRLDQPGLKVLAFHPHNVFLNLVGTDQLERAKACWQSPPRLVALRNSTRPGTRDLLTALLDRVARRGIPTATAGEVARSTTLP